MVINHMTGSDGVGTGSAGSEFDAASLSFPGVPYGPDDFNCCEQLGIGNCVDGYVCTTGQCEIEDYNDVSQVRPYGVSLEPYSMTYDVFISILL